MSEDIKDIELGEDENYVLTLVNDDGDEEDFVLLDVIEHEGSTYAVLQPESDVMDDDEAEVIIFRMEGNDEDGTTYMPIESEELLNTLFDKFLADLEEIED